VGLSETLKRWLSDALRVRRFDAAGGGRRWQGVQTFGNVNAEIAAASRPVGRRAGYYARNNPWCANGVNAIVAAAIGPGIKPQSQHPDRAVRETLHRRWQAWTDEADADGVLPFYGQQALMLRTTVESGECFAHMIPTAAGLRVRLLDGDMVPLDESRELEGGRRIIQGVQLDADGTRAGYWVHRTRPEVPTYSTELTFIAADAMAHQFLPLAPGQLRGISWLAPVLLRLHELDLYEDAQLVRQKVSALFAAFVVDPTGTAAPAGTPAPNALPGVLTTGLEPGTIKALPAGADIRFSEPAQIGDAIEFLKLQLRSLAAGLGIGIPEYLLTGDMTGANYSSLRAALVEFRTRLEQLQHSTIVFQFCRPIWRAWVLTELLAGRIAGDLDALLAVEWIVPARPWVDPQKDAEAARMAIADGLTSRRREVAALGWDVEELDAEIAADNARARALGLTFGDGTSGPSPGSQGPRPALRTVPNAA
jgi:lambda family phage portal protein